MRNSYDFTENREKLIKSNLAKIMNLESNDKTRGDTLLKTSKDDFNKTVKNTISDDEPEYRQIIGKRKTSNSMIDPSYNNFSRNFETINDAMLLYSHKKEIDHILPRKRKNSADPMMMQDNSYNVYTTDFTLNSSKENITE